MPEKSSCFFLTKVENSTIGSKQRSFYSLDFSLKSLDKKNEEFSLLIISSSSVLPDYLLLHRIEAMLRISLKELPD